MNALSTRHGDHPVDPAPDVLATANDYALGLQLYRIGMLSMTRLQLALERGDRSRAMEAIDDLHALDTRVERLVAALPLSPDDPRQREVGRNLKEEKMAVAFEKLALASGISGPGLASQPVFPRAGDAALPDDHAHAPVAGWPPAETRGARLMRLYGLRAFILFVIVAATLAALLMAL